MKSKATENAYFNLEHLYCISKLLVNSCYSIAFNLSFYIIYSSHIVAEMVDFRLI